MSLMQGFSAIDAELEKARSILRLSGYIPYVDHLVPPDVPWDNFVYYRRRLNQLVDTFAPRGQGSSRPNEMKR